jgi:rare lipoprotein A (peptidoglycan hydrolase)
MTRRQALALGVLALLAPVACRKKHKSARTPRTPLPAGPRPKVGWTETGVASWYGIPYHGRQAANGEIYNMNELTAAHRTLPFGAIVKVTSLTSSQSVTVRITDRGPFVGDRIIDLSRQAAREIDMIGPGIMKVRLQLVAYGPPRLLAEGASFRSKISRQSRRKLSPRNRRRGTVGLRGAGRPVQRQGKGREPEGAALTPLSAGDARGARRSANAVARSGWRQADGGRGASARRRFSENRLAKRWSSCATSCVIARCRRTHFSAPRSGRGRNGHSPRALPPHAPDPVTSSHVPQGLRGAPPRSPCSVQAWEFVFHFEIFRCWNN